MTTKPTIAVAMIIKNEEAIIKNTLDNIRKYVRGLTYFCICDTGSLDNSIEIVKQYLQEHHLDGEVFSEQWVDFSTNRNIVLERCRTHADYIMTWDADDRFVSENSCIDAQKLVEDVYCIVTASPVLKEGDVADINTHIYEKTLLFKSHLDVEWKGVLHEGLYFKDEEELSISHLGNREIFFVQSGSFGARNQNQTKKFEGDIQVLLKAFEEEPEKMAKKRYAFYIAKSYHALGDIDSAISWYQKRFDLTVLDQTFCLYPNLELELFLAGYNLALLYQTKISSNNIYADKAIALHLFLKNKFPNYKEPCYQLGKLYSEVYHDYILALSFFIEAKKIQDEVASNLILGYEEVIITTHLLDYNILCTAYNANFHNVALQYLQICEKKPFLNKEFTKQLERIKNILEEA